MKNTLIAFLILLQLEICVLAQLNVNQNNVVIFDDLFGTGVGQFNWLSSGTAGTGAAVTTLTGLSTAPGLLQFSTGTDTNGKAMFRSNSSMTVFGGGMELVSVRLRVPTLSDGTDTFTLWAGLMDSSSGNVTDAVCFIYSSQADYYTNTTKWSGLTANNNTRTEVPSSITVTANQWYVLTAVVNAAGNSVEFFVDGVSIGTSSSNIPTAVGRETGLGLRIDKVLGTTSRTMDADYVKWIYTPTTAR